MPVMAMGASYGSPMLNIVLGMSVSVAYSLVALDSSEPLLTRSFVMGPLPTSLIVSLASLILTLVFSIVYIYFHRFNADRTFGFLLIGSYLILLLIQLNI